VGIARREENFRRGGDTWPSPGPVESRNNPRTGEYVSMQT
jgi:hypothetical protein